jgi:hypothetical protein
MLLPMVDIGDLPDRRRRPRLRLAYDLRLSLPGETTPIEAKTEDVSCEGFFFVTDHTFFPRDTVDCELVIPAEEFGQPLEHEIVLHCRAEVVRVVQRGGGPGYGVACHVADYTVDRQILDHDPAVEYAI